MNDWLDDARNAADERAERERGRCRCGSPDWPGACLGPANCRCCQDDDPEGDE